MNCDKFSQYIDDLVDGELDQAIKAECEEHINSCASCKVIYDNYMFMITSLNDLGDLETSNITFPSDLHSNIMSSVLNSIEADASNSNIINMFEGGLNSENIVTINETSSDNVIDIAKIQENTTKENNAKENNAKEDKISFYKKYGNTLVAGFVSVFVATGAYQTYQYLRTPAVAQTPMITIDAGNGDNTTSQELSNNEALSNPEIQANTFSENNEPIADINTADTSTDNSQTAVGGGTNSVSSTDPSQSVSNTNDSVVTSDKPQTTDGVSASPSNNTATTTGAQPQAAMVASPKAKSATTTPEFKISVNCPDLDAYLEYLSSSPDVSINGVTKTADGIQVSGSSKDFDKFVSYAKNYSDIENTNIQVEYSDETLAKIKETGQFKFTLQQY